MHYYVWVITPAGTTIENAAEAVAKVLAPSEEDDDCNGHWDWYTIGGRWDGVIKNGEPPNFDPYATSPQVTARNVANAGTLVEKEGPYAFVLPDGEWIGKKVWNGESFVETVDFESKLRAALLMYSERLVVGVDCHC